MKATLDEAADQAVQLLIADPATRANPYSVYGALRAHEVYRTPLEIWFAATYATCHQVVRHAGFRRRHGDSWERRAMLFGSLGRRWLDDQARWMLWLDPPDHPRIRSLVGQSFSARYIEKQRPAVEQVVNGLIDAIAGGGDVDFVQQFALALPLTLICDMLGIPVSDRRNFREWTTAASGTLEPMPSEEVQDAADRATDAFAAYFSDLVDERRHTPGDDLLTKLIAAENDEGKLSREELISNAVLLLAAGFETTTNLLGNGILALLRNPAQWELLVGDPGLAANATEELLRYDSPVQMATPRVAITDIDIDGHVIAEGETVVAVVGSGNHDPARFDQPDRLDVQRQDPSPLSFGAGPHFCIGAALARLEGAVAFEALARRLPQLELLETDPTWLPTLNLHGVRGLRVRA
ncbi:MAG: cytochrome P450 [Chloroflexi bacterium]|nr:MAG: cytochrome P450 [Chloroflexota bacterium]